MSRYKSVSRLIFEDTWLRRWIIADLILLLIILILSSTAHCSPWTNQKPQSEVAALDNPVSYIFGYIEDADFVKYHGKTFTNIRIMPYAANLVYDRTIAFCSDMSNMFSGKGLFVVITYDRIMHQDGCYDLLGVHAAVDFEDNRPEVRPFGRISLPKMSPMLPVYPRVLGTH